MEDNKVEAVEEKQRIELTNKDVDKAFFRWWWLAEISYNYETMQGHSFCAAMMPALRKLWPDDEDFKAALKRESVYFNTEAMWGSPCFALALSMEQEYANAPKGSVTYEQMASSINGIKTALMGPLAGIGDTMDWATIQVLFLSLGMSIAMEGNWIGCLMAIPCVIVTFLIGYFFCRSTFSIGKSFVSNILSSGLMSKLMLAASIIANFMMGSLANSTISLALASESAQEVVDSILPGLLPLAGVALVYYCIAIKKIKVSHVTYGIIVVCLVLALVGIL